MVPVPIAVTVGQLEARIATHRTVSVFHDFDVSIRVVGRCSRERLASRAGPGSEGFRAPDRQADRPVLPTQVVLQPIPASAMLTDRLSTYRRNRRSRTSLPVAEAIDRAGSCQGRVAQRPGCRTAQQRRRQPRARMPRRRRLLSNRRASRLKASWPSATSSPIAPNSGRFPSSYCGVLFQRSQFSFVRGKSYPPDRASGRQWQNAVAIAKIVDSRASRLAGRQGARSSTPSASRRAGA